MARVALLAGMAAAAPLAGQTPNVAPADLNDHGAFEIFSDGKSIGTENFDIRAHAHQIEVQGDAELRVEQNGKKVDVRTSSNLVLDSHFDPLSYTWNQKGTWSSHLSIDFRSPMAHVRYRTVNGQDDQRDFKLEKDVLVLDDNVMHHYQLAVARYDQAKGGKQVFHAFIPQETLPGVVTLSFVDLDSPPVNEDHRTLRHFLLSTELAQIDLWADDQGHLQVVSAPDAHIQVVRKRQ